MNASAASGEQVVITGARAAGKRTGIKPRRAAIGDFAAQQKARAAGSERHGNPCPGCGIPSPPDSAQPGGGVNPLPRTPGWSRLARRRARSGMATAPS